MRCACIVAAADRRGCIAEPGQHFAGAQGGCQAECGSAAAMAGAAVVYLLEGGTTAAERRRVRHLR